MSIDAQVTVAHAGSSSSTPIPRAFGGTLLLASMTAPMIWCQMDEMSQAEAKAYGGAQAGEGPYDRFNGYTSYPITLLRGDKLTDTTNIDPQTGTNTVYRIIGRPEKFPGGYTEFVADLVIGT